MVADEPPIQSPVPKSLSIEQAKSLLFEPLSQDLVAPLLLQLDALLHGLSVFIKQQRTVEVDSHVRVSIVAPVVKSVRQNKAPSTSGAR
jgi:hypothetical protein